MIQNRSRSQTGKTYCPDPDMNPKGNTDFTGFWIIVHKFIDHMEAELGNADVQPNVLFCNVFYPTELLFRLG